MLREPSEVVPLKTALLLVKIQLPILRVLFSFYLLRLGPQFNKRLTISLAHAVFRRSVLAGVKFEIDARKIEITTDFLDVVKALIRREGNNFRVIVFPGQPNSKKLAGVCFARGIEYRERPPQAP